MSPVCRTKSGEKTARVIVELVPSWVLRKLDPKHFSTVD